MVAYRREHLQRTLGDRYTVGALLGRGAFASVYLAENRNLGRLEAIKVLSELHDEKPDFAQRFAEESRLVASLDHPHIVKVFDSGQADGLFWTSMQYIDGPTLDRELAARGSLDPDAVLRLAIPILDALAYSHRRGVIHRDIKPSNLILSKSGQVYLMDFGIAKSLASSLKTATGNLWGTPEYMAPEVVDGSPVDGRTDLYSLGTTLYEMMAGRRPFKSTDFLQTILRRVREEPSAPSQFCQDITLEQDALILKMIARLPEHRFQTAEEARAAFVDLTGSAWQDPWGRPVAKTNAVSGESFKAGTGRAWSTLWRSSSGWLLSKGSELNRSRIKVLVGLLAILGLAATAFLTSDSRQAAKPFSELGAEAEGLTGSAETTPVPRDTSSTLREPEGQLELPADGAEVGSRISLGDEAGDGERDGVISIPSTGPSSTATPLPGPGSSRTPSPTGPSESPAPESLPSASLSTSLSESPSTSPSTPSTSKVPPRGSLPPIVPPKILESVEPELSDQLNLRCDKVEIIVTATVEADGSVGKVRTLQGHPAECAEPVVQAVRAYRFSPALDSEDQPVKGSTTLSFRFGGS